MGKCVNFRASFGLQSDFTVKSERVLNFRRFHREIEFMWSSREMKIVDMEASCFSRGSKDLTDRFLSKK